VLKEVSTITMKKQHVIYLIVSVLVIILFAGGWYLIRYKSCLKKIIYIPPREQKETGGGFYGSLRGSSDKGDYYSLGGMKFKTSDDAMRACIWK